MYVYKYEHMYTKIFLKLIMNFFIFSIQTKYNKNINITVIFIIFSIQFIINKF